MRRQMILGMALIAGLSMAAPLHATVADNGTSVSVPPEVGTQGATATRSDPWVAIPACPVGVSRPAGAVAGDRFFVIGGEESGGVRNGYAQEYDPVGDAWDNTNAVMPTGVSNLCAAAIGTDIYVPGGWTGSVALDALQVYHTATDSWETVATDPLPVALFAGGCAAHEGKIYLFGGTTGIGDDLDTTYIYDPAAAAGSRWTTGAVAPVAGNYGDAISADGYVFYSGIRNATADLADVLRYDPAADSWTTMPSLTTARGGARVWTYEGKLAVGGGGWSSYLTSVEEYDLSTGTGGTWTAGNSLVSGARTFAAGQDSITGVLYKGGGWAGAYLTGAESSAYVVPVELMHFTIE